MASWDELKQVVGENFKVAEDIGNAMRLTFQFDNGNQLDVVVSYQHNDNLGEWAQVEAAVGPFDEVDLEGVVRKSADMLCGAISSDGDFVTVRHSTPIAHLDAEEIVNPINAIASSANDFTAEFGGEEGDEEAQ